MFFTKNFAYRLNSFKSIKAKSKKKLSKQEISNIISKMAKISGLTHLDLNYPDHLTDIKPNELKSIISNNGLKLNGLAMRYYGNQMFENGAFLNPNKKIHNKAVELTIQAIDTLIAMGGNLLTIWPGQDGYDYPFQIDYRDSYKTLVETFRKVALHNKKVKVSIEYKPSGSRSYSILPSMSTTLLLIKDIGLPNLGVTLDFCHSLMARENPANAASQALRDNRLYGVHLNDGYGERDDGLTIGSVHLLQTIELLYVLAQYNYKGVIYFDTFPVGINPIDECRINIQRITEMNRLINNLSPSKFRKYLPSFIKKSFLSTFLDI